MDSGTEADEEDWVQDIEREIAFSDEEMTSIDSDADLQLLDFIPDDHYDTEEDRSEDVDD